MDQEKRLLLAFAISFAVLMIWRAVFIKEARPPSRAPQRAQAPPISSPQPEAKALVPLQLPVTEGSKAEEIVIEGGNLYRVTLSTQGAVVKSWVLKKYLDEQDHPLDVVNRAACEQLGFPISLNLGDADLSSQLNTALYVATPGNASLKAPVKVEFVYNDGKIQARKQFVFGLGYEVHVEVSVSDGQHYLRPAVAWPGGFGDHSLPPAQAAAMERALYQPAGSTKVIENHLTSSWFGRLSSAKSGLPEKEPQEEVPGPFTLAGLADRYFVDVFLPDSPDVKFDMMRRPWTPPGWNGEEKNKPKPLLAILGGLQPRPLAFRLFVAPKELDVLRSAKPPLDGLVDFGWFSVVAKPLFLGLRYIYDHWIHNFGWAIILLTAIINLALFPLKLKSIRSAQEMQKIAPQVKSIQERYKQYKFNDPRKQRMNEEVMKLYREHGINPLGGCLPMALQLPFLYGFYNVLNLSIELRHAPWAGWIKDLSAPDKLHILPTVMIVTMFILQKMTPMATADPGQQRMMMITPLLFGMMFYGFASGLVLYWLTSNIVGIAQQAFINRRMPAPQPVPVPRKAS